MHQGHHSATPCMSRSSLVVLVSQNLKATQKMCNTTGRAVRSGLQKLSVTNYQVCDASRTSLCHAMHEPINPGCFGIAESEGYAKDVQHDRPCSQIRSPKAFSHKLSGL